MEFRIFTLVGEPLQELIATAAKMGVLVCSRSDLVTITRLTTEYQIVVLFAHWKGSEILNSDFILPIHLDHFIERVHGDQSLIGSWLKAHLKMLDGSEDREAPRRRFLNQWLRLLRRQPLSLREVLSEGMALSARRRPTDAGGVDYLLEAENARIARVRDHFDSIFEGLLRPGNRLELFDGLHSKEAVESAVSPEFDGIIDFATCTSTVLGDYIAAKRKHKLRTVQFPTVQEFLWGAKCVGLTLQLLREHGLSYLQARKIAGSMLEQAIAENA
jgi:hypothetical protein